MNQILNHFQTYLRPFLYGKSPIKCNRVWRKRHVYKHLHQPIYQQRFRFSDHFRNQSGDLNQSYHRTVNLRPIKLLEFFYIVGVVNTDWKVLWIQNNFSPQWRQLLFAYKWLFSIVCSRSVCFLNITFLNEKYSF